MLLPSHTQLQTRRDLGHINDSIGGCRTNVSWSIWCSIDIALRTLILFLVILILWKIVFHNKGTKATVSRSKKYRRLTDSNIPKPTLARDNSFDFEIKSKSKEDSNSTVVDPYHLMNSVDDSLISKDSSFKAAISPPSAYIKAGYCKSSRMSSERSVLFEPETPRRNLGSPLEIRSLPPVYVPDSH